MYPTGILKNTATGRWHPISFRPAPFASGSGPMRYKSLGHHTAGFASLDEAREWVLSNPDRATLIPDIWEWDGQDVPAMVVFLKE